MIDFILQPMTMILLGTAYLSYTHDRNTQREADNIQRNLEHLLNTFEEYEHREDRENTSKNNEKNHQIEERYLLGTMIEKDDLEQIRVKKPKKYEKRTKKTSKP